MFRPVIRRGILIRQFIGTNYLGISARSFSVINGDINKLPETVKKFVEEKANKCQPDNIHICDGSDAENSQLLGTLQNSGMVKPLPKYENCWLARTDPRDVARVESKTVISTQKKRDTIPIPQEGVTGQLGYWMSPGDMESALQERFPGCMKGRTMYVVPFSMGPIGSPLSKVGIELTDSAYVAASMRIMTRMGEKVLEALDTGEFTRCLHSVGHPLPSDKEIINSWPCNPEKVLIAHIPDRNEISSFGSGYGGNSLLGKKCFALRLGSILARNEGWMAEHMLILGITNPKGEKRYVAAAFPSACGKTNLAMMVPTLPGYKVECVGDDIAWMRFDEDGRLRAINPEAGFFGVAPGTSMATNPNAMLTVERNTVFTNVAETDDGGYWWEGLEEDIPVDEVTSWKGHRMRPGQKNHKGEKLLTAHPNSRFCTPARQCPMMDPEWENPRGVPIDAILFGGRRSTGVPLVYQAFNWQHGVFIGGSMRSEATAAAEHKGSVLMHDPFAMRPFFGYNFGDYLAHWLSLSKKPGVKMPKVFHVNWFRKNEKGEFIWPGFGENSRVLDWICRRIDGEDCAETSAIGYIPKEGTINMDGLQQTVDMQELFRIPQENWQQEVVDIGKYFSEQVGSDLPEEIAVQLEALEERISDMS